MSGAAPDATLPMTANKHSLGRDALRRLRHNRAAMAGVFLLLLILLLAFVGPFFNHNAYDSLDWAFFGSPPTLTNDHWFGTDVVGRDLFVRTLYGARISLMVGVVATAVALLIGVTYGSVAGYVGGKTDDVMMRIVDVIYSLPFMFFVILLMVVFGKNILLIFVAIGAVEWLTMARIVRGQTLSLKQKEFVEAARASGLSDLQIIVTHIVPNVMGPVIVYVTLTIPQVILAESFLSFLGLGVQEPMTSWGVLISDGASQMEDAPWMLLFPASFLAITLFCFNFIGDGLRDALDPRDR
jgi:oligopeptide transport system permease protein